MFNSLQYAVFLFTTLSIMPPFNSWILLLQLGLPGSDAHVPRLSFSAALTRPMRNPGTIVFNEIFVNENNVYDPKTGESHEDLLSNRETG